MVAHGFPPDSVAGTELVAWHLSKSLQRRGHDLLIFHRVADPMAANYSWREDTVDDLRTVRFVNNLVRPTVALSYQNAAAERAFVMAAERFKPDVVHIQHAIHLSASLVTRCVAEGLPTVLTLHDYWFICPTVQLLRPDATVCSGPAGGFRCFQCVGRKEPGTVALAKVRSHVAPLARRALRLIAQGLRHTTLREPASEAVALVERPGYMRQTLAAADVVVAPSRFVVQVLASNGFQVDRIAVASNGIAVERAVAGARKTPNARLRFAFIGSVLPHKGLHIALNALRHLPPGSFDFHVYGETGAPEAVRIYAAKLRELALGLPVLFHGRFEPHELGSVLSNIDVVVVPSLWCENSPNVILEAFAAQTPVISSDIGGALELVAHGLNGWLFRSGDAADLACCMQAAIQDRAMLLRMRGACVRPKTPEQSAFEYEGFYQRAIKLHHNAHSKEVAV